MIFRYCNNSHCPYFNMIFTLNPYVSHNNSHYHSYCYKKITGIKY